MKQHIQSIWSFYKQCIRNRLVPVSRPLLKVLQISQIPICSDMWDTLYGHIQTSNLKGFHPEILKKSNHILRNCENADIGNLMYGIPDLTIPRLSSYEFGKFLFLPTIFVVSMIQKLKSNGRISLHGLRWSP